MNADQVAEDHSGEERIATQLYQALARRRRFGPQAATHLLVIPPPSDREVVRGSPAVLQGVAAEELTDVALEEAVRQIEADAASDAQRVVAYLRQMAAHLRSVDCVTPQQIEEFVDAMNDVLLQIYRELQKTRPSPTRLRQLVAQYAVDPRRPVAVPAHHIDVRRNDEGLTVAVLPPGVGRIRSLPYPGTVVRDPCAAQLLEDLLLSSPPNYPAAMQSIELRLGYVPDASSSAHLQPSVAAPGPVVTVDEGAGCITVSGRSYMVDLMLLQVFQFLLKAPGSWVSSAELEKSPLLEGTRIDRLLRKLPRALRALIEGRRGKGYRLRMERLCQNPSIDRSAEKEHDVRQTYAETLALQTAREDS
ncbi:MAG: hypothetical protein JNK76_24635 [Planctomycetales bacterium]|nr:hypothetical protein [Planctomycetales bacterium]MBN8626597.1 hypothetical protein [Planctomycetota bacterium]